MSYNFFCILICIYYFFIKKNVLIINYYEGSRLKCNIQNNFKYIFEVPCWSNPPSNLHLRIIHPQKYVSCWRSFK